MAESSTPGISFKALFKGLSESQYLRFSALLDECFEMAAAERGEWLAALERSEPSLFRTSHR
jgi:hypothetical protein